jgi:uncharacterized membrane protein
VVIVKPQVQPLVPRIKPGGAYLLPFLAVLLALVALAVVSLLGFGETRETLTRVRVAGATAAARSIAADLDRAIGYGVPLTELPGVEPYLETRLGSLSELRFFVVTGSDGRRLYHSGIGASQVDDLVARVTPELLADGWAEEGLARLDIEPFALVRVPLVAESGAVWAAVEPGEITRNLTRKILAAWPFWVGCLLLALAWAAVAVRGGVLEPLARLAAAMRAAGEGRFDRLLVRRARDGVGQCLLAFNAIVAGLHARRLGVIAQAEDVRHAVFDPEVAAAAAVAQDAALADLGEGLATCPERFRDPRSSDADLFALTLAAAGLMTITDGVVAGLPPLPIMIVVAGTLLVGLALGWILGWRRWLVVTLATLFLAILLSNGLAVPEGLAALAMDGVSGLVVGLAWGVAWRQRRASRVTGGLGGGLWVVMAGSLAGAAFAWGLLGDLLTISVGAILLATISLAGALTAPGRRG